MPKLKPTACHTNAVSSSTVVHELPYTSTINLGLHVWSDWLLQLHVHAVTHQWLQPLANVQGLTSPPPLENATTE